MVLIQTTNNNKDQQTWKMDIRLVLKMWIYAHLWNYGPHLQTISPHHQDCFQHNKGHKDNLSIMKVESKVGWVGKIE
jgi:hypothetical protein